MAKSRQQKAADYFLQMRKQLDEKLGLATTPGDFRRQATWGGRNVMDPLNGSGFYRDENALNAQYGVSPSDALVQEYIDGMGGNPYVDKPSRAVLSKGGSQGTSGSRSRFGSSGKKETEQSLLDRLLQSYQTKVDEANAANDSRYADILGRLEDRYARNMDRVNNYGNAMRSDLAERQSTTAGDLQAMLSQRGLGNSTIVANTLAKNARDFARENVRLNENIDNRAAQYDQALSGDVASFMERRNDVAPDPSLYMTLANQYGKSGDGQGFQQNQGGGYGNGGYQPMYNVPYYNTPGPIGRAPAVVNLFGGATMGGGIPQLRGLTSNAYPTVRDRKRVPPYNPQQLDAATANWDAMRKQPSTRLGPAGSFTDPFMAFA